MHIRAHSADKAGLIDAARLLEQRWEGIEGSPAVVKAFVAWCRAHRARHVDGMIAALQPDLLIIDHRPLGWPEIVRYAVVSLVREQPDVEHGVLLAERIVAVNDGGLVNRGTQRQFGAGNQLTMLIPAYYVVVVLDGRIGRFEGFPAGDPAPARGRLEELTEASNTRGASRANPRTPSVWAKLFLREPGVASRGVGWPDPVPGSVGVVDCGDHHSE